MNTGKHQNISLYHHTFIATQLDPTGRPVEFSCVAIMGLWNYQWLRETRKPS